MPGRCFGEVAHSFNLTPHMSSADLIARLEPDCRDPDRPWYGHVPVETLGPWLRQAEIGDTPDQPPSLFLGGIGAEDVIQGALGDCCTRHNSVSPASVRSRPNALT